MFALGWALTSGSLAVLTLAAPTAPRAAELAVLVVANLVATLVRFLLLRRWVFAPRGAAARPGGLARVRLDYWRGGGAVGRPPATRAAVAS